MLIILNGKTYCVIEFSACRSRVVCNSINVNNNFVQNIYRQKFDLEAIDKLKFEELVYAR
jgi:lantibiotic modifying enzyme